MTFSQTEYARNRYHSDPEFRKRIIVSVSKYNKSHREAINQKQNQRYANRTPEQIQARKDYLHNLRMKRRISNV